MFGEISLSGEKAISRCIQSPLVLDPQVGVALSTLMSGEQSTLGKLGVLRHSPVGIGTALTS